MNASEKLLLRELIGSILTTRGAEGCPYQKNTADEEIAKQALELIDRSMIRFEFVFEGTENQFRFFRDAVKKKIPDADVTLDNYDDVGFHCSVKNDAKIAFLIGIVCSICYTHFEHLNETQLKPPIR